MKIKAIYDDRLRFIQSIGDVEIKRASHVEPQGTKWIADMSPSNGPVLGPFDTRSQALKEEQEWLIKSWKRELCSSGDLSQSGGSSSDHSSSALA
jgi:predicted GIY-YIG superfamily endonuclease